MAGRLEPDRERRERDERGGQQRADPADEQVEGAGGGRGAGRAAVGGHGRTRVRPAHRVPSGGDQPASVPWRLQSHRPAASAACVST